MADNLNFWNGLSQSTWVPNYILLLDPKLGGYNKVISLSHNIKIIMGPNPTGISFGLLGVPRSPRNSGGQLQYIHPSFLVTSGSGYLYFGEQHLSTLWDTFTESESSWAMYLTLKIWALLWLKLSSQC